MLNKKLVEIPAFNTMTKQEIKEKWGDSKIYSLVFDFEPQEGDYATSPFRKDENPGAFFVWYNGYLRFVDFANTNKRMVNINCFDAVQYYYNIKNFYDVLVFIEANLSEGNVNIDEERKGKKLKRRKKINKAFNKKLVVFPRKWKEIDKKYWWDKYKIKKKDLEEDKVFPLKSFAIVDNKKLEEIEPLDITYAYTDFDKDVKKIYRPYKKGSGKWYSTTKKDDIGGIYDIEKDYLIITKSYKDYRVLKNEKINVCWLGSENTIPSTNTILKKILSNKKKIVIFYDNDKAGKIGSKILKEVLVKLDSKVKVKRFFIPLQMKQKDISDLIDNNYKNYKKVINELRKYT